MIVISDKEAMQMEMNRLRGELDGIRVDRQDDARKIPYAVSEAAAMRDVFQRAMYECKDRAEAAEARCETLEKMVKEYQDVIVPGYRERAEKAEKEIERLKDIMRDHGIMVIPSKYPGCKSEWNLPSKR